MHMVHESSGKKTVIVGILYTTGRHDLFLAKVSFTAWIVIQYVDLWYMSVPQMEGYIKKIGDMKGTKEKVGVVDPREIRRGNRKYYWYVGSLIAPSCI